MLGLLLTVILLVTAIGGQATDFYEDSPPPLDVCEADLLKLCQMDTPIDIEQSFSARMCLRAYRDVLSDECAAFLKDSPSIIEPCFHEINTFCQEEQPVERVVFSCLMSQIYAGISQECAVALGNRDDQLDIASTDHFYFLLDDDSVEMSTQINMAVLWTLRTVRADQLIDLLQLVATQILQLEGWFDDWVKSTSLSHGSLRGGDEDDRVHWRSSAQDKAMDNGSSRGGSNFE